MAVSWVQTVAQWNGSPSPVNSASFTPTAANQLLEYIFDNAGANHSIGLTGSASTMLKLTPPGNYTDTQNDTHAIGYCASAVGGAQTVGATDAALAGNTIVGLAWEYAGPMVVSGLVAPDVANPGIGAGAIQGTAMFVSTGGILLAVCKSIRGTSPTSLTSPSGTNRGSSVANATVCYCATEYAGPGTITPSFTTNVSTNTSYSILQFLLAPPGPGTSWQMQGQVGAILAQ